MKRVLLPSAFLAIALIGLAVLLILNRRPPGHLSAPHPPPQGLPALDSSLLDPGGNFVLHVSNQSNAIDPVDITVWIDGKCVIRDDFALIDGSNWRAFRLSLARGEHELVAKSEKGNATLRTSFFVSPPRWGSEYAALCYVYRPELKTPIPRQLSFHLQEQPPTWGSSHADGTAQAFPVSSAIRGWWDW